MAEKKRGCLSVIGAIAIIGVIIGVVGSSGKEKENSKTETKVSVSTEKSASVTAKVETEKATDDSKAEQVSQEANDVVYDDGSVKITYTGYEAEELFSSAKIKFLIENNSDKKIHVENFNLNINGYTVDTWFYEEVPAGKKVNAEMSIYTSELKDNGIDTLGTVDLNFKCVDSDTFQEMFVTDTVNIIFDESVTAEENIDDYQLVAQGGGVSVYYTGTKDGNLVADQKFNFLVVNDSDVDVTVSADDISVNDFAVTDLFSADCAAGKKTNETISLYSSDAKKNNIEKVEKLELSLKCYKQDTYGLDGYIFEENSIQITFE